MIKNILSLIILAVFLGSCKKGNTENENRKETSSLKLMSYNIHHGVPEGLANDAVQLDGIADVINDFDPDIIALQELDSITERAPVNELKELSDLTGMTHYSFAKAIDYQGGAYGIGVLSKLPILNEEVISLPMPDVSGEPRKALVTIIELSPKQHIKFVCTHLDIESNRLSQIEKLNEIFRNDTLPVFLAGDFNDTPQSEPIKKIKEVFTLLCENNCPFTAPASNPRRTIDYIMLNSMTRDIFHKTSYDTKKNTVASDHLPVIASFTY